MKAAPTLDVERRLAHDGAGLVVGCDEVGRGAIAGPVAVGVVALNPSEAVIPEGLRDSKLLTARARARLYPAVLAWGAARAVGLASAAEVDEIGIVAALGRAARRALAEIRADLTGARPPVILLDGRHDWLAPVLREDPLPMLPCIGVLTRVAADRDCASVAAASVLAKVQRDRLMVEASARRPGYAWESNKGYGSAAHLDALARLGATEEHRRTWLRPPIPAVNSAAPTAP